MRNARCRLVAAADTWSSWRFVGQRLPCSVLSTSWLTDFPDSARFGPNRETGSQASAGANLTVRPPRGRRPPGVSRFGQKRESPGVSGRGFACLPLTAGAPTERPGPEPERLCTRPGVHTGPGRTWTHPTPSFNLKVIRCQFLRANKPAKSSNAAEDRRAHRKDAGKPPPQDRFDAQKNVHQTYILKNL